MEIHNNDGKFWIKSKQVEELYHELTMEIMINIVRRLNKRGTQDLIDNPYIWQLEKLNDMHQLTEENVKLIAKYADISEEVFRDVIANEGFKIYQDSHQQLAEALGSNAQPNYLVQESLDALARQTIGDVNNLINTTLPASIQKSYKSALETAVAGTVAGIKSHDKAVREAVIQMYNNGFTGFKDKAGRTWTAERYAKTVVRTTTFRTYREMREQSAEDLGVDTFYYSKKAQAREMCAPLQGEIVTKGVAREIKGEKVKSLSDYGYGTPGGCLGINCGHYLTPFVIGVNYKPSSHSYVENLTPEEARQNALDMAKYKAYERELKAVRDKKRLSKELNDKEYLEQLRARERTLKAGKKHLIEKNPTVIGKYPSEKVVDKAEKVYNEGKKENKPLTLSTLKKNVEKLQLEEATYKDVIKLGKQVTTFFELDKHLGDKDKLKEVFSHFREMGGEVPKESWAKGSNKQVKEQLEHAFSYYPKDWAEVPFNSGRKILARKNSRGFFVAAAYKASGKGYDTKYENYLNGYFTIVTDGTRKTTPFHEIGHMVQRSNSDITRIEKEWIESRTKSENYTLMKDIFPGFGYGISEKVKKDNFVSPYIGKHYNHTTEVLTMGLQGIYEPSELFRKEYDTKERKYVEKKITDDEEFLHLTIGLLLKG